VEDDFCKRILKRIANTWSGRRELRKSGKKTFLKKLEVHSEEEGSRYRERTGTAEEEREAANTTQRLIADLG